jgi:hypothetical protein
MDQLKKESGMKYSDILRFGISTLYDKYQNGELSNLKHVPSYFNILFSKRGKSRLVKEFEYLSDLIDI